MKNLLIAIVLFCANCLCAQTERGVKPVSEISQQTSGTTRAVVIGVSDYSEDLIPDLNYAHRDAEAFAAWLRSPAGGNLPPENLQLLTNEQATTANMIMAMDKLIDESKPGDRAFIHFSGHGDVERVTKFSNGYLLTYDSPAAVYGAGAFDLRYLQDILSTLSENEVQVIMISDACRAGKLAGSSVNGTQITANRLAKQFANEIKILSCQPEEFSLEGEQWGGGRGCFSFHLENALYGFADANGDQAIDLRELGRYLEDNVSSEAEPNSQFPMVQGMKKSVMAKVDATAFAEKKEQLEGRKLEFAAIDNKSLESLVLEEADSNIQKIYTEFLAAIDAERLMDSSGTSANDYYDILIADASISKLHGDIKRKFCAALLNEGQGIINRVLKTDPQMLNNIWAGKIEYDHLPGYFNRATEILGESHYAYNSLKAKEFYFKSKIFRKENYKDTTKHWLFEQQQIYLNRAIALDSFNAIFYLDLAVAIEIFNPILHEQGEKVLKILEKGISFSPKWALGYYYLGLRYGFKNYKKKSIEAHKKSIMLDSSFLSNYNWISWNYENGDSAAYWRNLYTEKFYEKFEKNPEKITAFDYHGIGNCLWILGRFKEAKKILLLGNEKSNGKFVHFIDELFVVEIDLFEFEEAILTGKKNKENFPNDILLINESHIGAINFFFLGKKSNANFSFKQFKNFSGEEGTYLKLLFLLKTQQYQEAEQLGINAIKQYPNNKIFQFLLGETYSALNEKAEANDAWSKIIKEVNFKNDTRFTYAYPNYVYTILSYQRLSDFESRKNAIEFLDKRFGNNPKYYFHKAIFDVDLGRQKDALKNLKKAAKLGWQPAPLQWLFGTLCDPFLDPIRETPEYYEFVKTHYPYYLEVATKIPYKN